MPTFNGTAGNDSWTIITGGEFVIDGHEGIDTVSTGISPGSDFTFSLNPDGTVSLDTLSGASQVMHATLKNVERLAFSDRVIDLTTYFDSTPPALTGTSPATGATNVATGSDIVMTFSESIKPGSGTVTLQNAAGQTIESYTIGSSANLAISGNALTVNPTADLAPGATYTLTVSSGAVKDLSGNGLAAAASVSFTTDPKVVVGANNAPLAGTAGNDVLAGDARNNIFVGSAGKDTIDGGAGIDMVQLSGAHANYTVSLNGASATVSDASGNTMNLANVERLQFSDATYAFDIAGDAGQVYRLYQAAFNRVPDAGGLGFWISAMDKGVSLVEIASGFIKSAEFQAMYGANPTSTSMVTTMYTNVLHRAPDNSGIAFWVGVLDDHKATSSDVLIGFSESAENQQNLIGVIGNGFPYTPFG
jgi:Ca2+-binding RTX toxin-like protein